jgi:hypothetical protein
MDFSDLYNWEALEYYLNFGQDVGDLMGGPHGEDDDDDEDDGDDEPKAKKDKKAKGDTKDGQEK